MLTTVKIFDRIFPSTEEEYEDEKIDPWQYSFFFESWWNMESFENSQTK